MPTTGSNLKRSHSAMESNGGVEQKPQLLLMFENFRAELDEHHDRRERIVKSSRDITAASKKMCACIFLTVL